ncbi:hypothetical protein ACTI_40110 [Actinoplanes sp. OR16]|uniref:hypothetical protein n=1 Tax=Actinoplanes sp. OR16 TaxID=946334 RepID=UPI000F6F7A93|nr:hypothetical protein [Actinoplanes sp. OR16]BBH67326.1 hypothetical protein ACTI_40110 [Actinoplanes sp. OR16]
MTKNNTVLYVTAGVLVVVLAVIAFITFPKAEENDQATAQAEQLREELVAAGINAPPADQIAAVLGDDGGAACLDPGDALRRNILLQQLTNGASGPGQRPVIADGRIVQGQILIMEIYCPDTLAAFRQIVDDLKFAKVAS